MEKNHNWITPSDIFEATNDLMKEASIVFKEADTMFKDVFNKKRNFPATNIVQNEKGVTLEIAIPGFKKEDVNISLEGNVLTVSCKTEETNRNFTTKEFSSSSFTRSFNISQVLDKNKITSSLKDGMLFIEIPKIEKTTVNPEKKNIPVN